MDFLKRQGTNKGSTLIWIMVTALVLTMILTVGLTIASQQHTKAVNTHISSQAYYTALSTTQTIESWIKNGDADALSFISSLSTPGTERIIDFAEGDLPANTGSCNVSVKNITTASDATDKFKITSSATYQDSQETVSVVIQKEPSTAGGSFSYPVSGFDPEVKYGTVINQINNGTNGFESDNTPVNIAFRGANGASASTYDYSNNATVKRDFNPDNRTTLNKIITDSNSTREATWVEVQTLYGDFRSSGPYDAPWIGEGLRENTSDTGPNAKMMMLTPKNGKLMINPVSRSSSGNLSFSQNLNTWPNIKLTLFPITDTAGKSVKLRLANSGTVGKRASNEGIPHFAFIGLDFYDNKTTAASPVQIIPVPGITQEAVTIDNPASVSSGVTRSSVNGVPFYPNAWNDCTVYLKNNSNETINSELDFGNYVRIHTYSTMDYRSWGNYITYHWGYKNNNYDLFSSSKLNITEGLTNKDAKNKSGFPYPPVYWGNNFSLYLLDGPQTSYSARIMQGVNLVNNAKSDGSAGGVIYSNRGLQIGGALTPTALDRYAEGVQTDLDGFDNNPTWSAGGQYALMYHQVIKDTDIVLTTNGTESKNSEILHPEGTKNFTNTTLSILGGTIYVGNKQTLQIDSEIKDGLTVKGEIAANGFSSSGTERSGAAATFFNYVSNGSSMYIKPNKIEVAAGGTLTILGNQNDHDNVETDIYINGGTLNINEGAKIKGNIYVYNGGRVNVNGSFRLNSKQAAPMAGQPDPRKEDGIIVYGEDAIGKNGITAAGSVCVTATVSGSLFKGSVISGSANKIHLVGKSKDLFYSKDPRAGKGTYLTEHIDQIFSNPADFMCDDCDQFSGECHHFGVKDNGWKSGVYADQ